MEYIYLFGIINFFFFFSCLSVFYVEKTLYSVFMLITSFVFGAFICIFLEAYFIAFLFIIVYVGAIAVLFLFVLMLINFVDNSNVTFFNKSRFLFIFSTPVFFLVFWVMYTNRFSDIIQVQSLLEFSFLNFFIYQPNSVLIGQLLYTYYFIPFILASLVLFVAMLGAILLTSSGSTIFVFSVYSQVISEQVNTQPQKVVVIKNPILY